SDKTEEQVTELELEFDRASSQIALHVYQPTPSGVATLQLCFEYHPEQSLAPIHLDTEQYYSGISRFYADTWVDNSDCPAAFEDITSGDQIISTSGLVITEDHVHDYRNLIKSSSKWYALKNAVGASQVPVDFVLVAATSNILHIASSSLAAGLQLDVVQLFNRVRLVGGSGVLAVGDHIRSDLVVDEIVNIPIGHLIKMSCTCYCNDQPVAVVECALRFTLVLGSTAEIAVLETKAWFQYLDNIDIRLSPVCELEIHIDSKYRYLSDSAYSSISTTGGLDSISEQEQIQQEFIRQKRNIQNTWGNEFWKHNPAISPLRGSLAVWGLSADDIGLASFHGTSTVANDKNESDVLNATLKHIGRTPGNVLPVVCQKWLTGHSKGAAAGYMLNGVIQSMRTGLIPGNRNADNIDPDFQQYDYALYLSKTIQTPGIKAALLTSFGFGQVGGELLIVHPDYLFASVDPKEIDEYNKNLAKREKKAYRYWQDTLVGNHPFVQVKENPPYTADQEKRVYLDPFARAKYDAKTKQYKF
ncbi:fatty acid synthase alpha subunit Lsd1, partial [Coemansia sp. RSA 1721]